MSVQKKPIKSKFIAEDLNDFLNSSQFLKESPKNKKQLYKRKRVENDTTNIMVKDPAGTKKKKVVEGDFEICGETRQKILHVMNHQLETRKAINDSLLRNFLEVITQMEADYNALRDNEQKLEHLTGSFMKCIQQGTAAHKQKLKAFKEIHTSFKNQCEEAETIHKGEISKLGEQLEEDMSKYKEKLISDTKRTGWETLRKSFIQAMQDDF